jgi:hypothetical protein
MASHETSLTLICDGEQIPALTATLENAGVDVQVSQLRQLDGAAATSWIAVATVAIPTVPVLLDSLREFLTRNRPKKLTITRNGEQLDIDNPDPAAVDRLIDFMTSHEDA